MSVNKKYEIDMCNGSVPAKVLTFALPIIFSGILQLLFNAADIVVVGRFAGDNSMAAVGSTGSLVNLVTNLFIGLSVGANVLVARYYGAKDDEGLKKAVHTSVKLAIISGIILTVVGVLGAKHLLVLMKAPGEVLKLATIYLRVYFLGMVAMMIYNFGSAILRATGDTKRPLYILIISGIINVLLNLLFVIVFQMDVAGVALATVISQFVSAGLILLLLIKADGAIKLDMKQLRIDRELIGDMAKIGLPAGFQGMLFSLSNVVIQSSVNLFGDTAIAGNSAAGSIEGFVYVAMNAFYQTAISFTGQNYGAGKFERIKKILYSCIAFVGITGLVFGNLVSIFSPFLVGIYSKSSEVIAIGSGRLAVIASTYALCGMMDVMVGMLRGLGYSIVPMFVSLIGACGLRIVWIATVFQIEEFHKIETIYYSYPVTWAITFAAHTICFVIVYKKLMKRVRDRYRTESDMMEQ